MGFLTTGLFTRRTIDEAYVFYMRVFTVLAVVTVTLAAIAALWTALLAVFALVVIATAVVSVGYYVARRRDVTYSVSLSDLLGAYNWVSTPAYLTVYGLTVFTPGVSIYVRLTVVLVVALAGVWAGARKLSRACVEMKALERHVLQSAALDTVPFDSWETMDEREHQQNVLVRQWTTVPLPLLRRVALMKAEIDSSRALDPDVEALSADDLETMKGLIRFANGRVSDPFQFLTR